VPDGHRHGIALLAVGLSVSSCVPVSGPGVSQHRVQPGNGKGHLIEAILDKRLGEYLNNRLATRFAGLKRSGPSKSGAPVPQTLTTLAKPSKPATAPAATPSATGLGMQDYYDMFWLGNITIGSPDQGPFSVVFDTGSADLWVVDSSCGSGASWCTKKQCALSPQFNSSVSTSYSVDGTPFQIGYGDGSYALGFQGVDTVKIADSNGGSPLAIPNTGFAQAINVDSRTLAAPMAGILGLGFQCSSTNVIPPPFLNAVQQGLVPQSIFSIYLETESDETAVDDAPAGGVFTFGGLDSTNCGSVVDWIDLSTLQFWQFPYDAINVGSKSIDIYGLDVISDSGTSLLIGDYYIVKPIAKAVGAKLNDDYGVYTIKCDATYNPVTFVIHGNSYNLTSSVLNVDIGLGNNQCLFAAIPVPFFSDFMGIDWILGDPFIRQWCAVHDVVNQQIGFAPNLNLQSS
jgi:hypothetical protein